jgi:hypothetical protein
MKGEAAIEVLQGEGIERVTVEARPVEETFGVGKVGAIRVGRADLVTRRGRRVDPAASVATGFLMLSHPPPATLGPRRAHFRPRFRPGRFPSVMKEKGTAGNRGAAVRARHPRPRMSARWALS